MTDDELYDRIADALGADVPAAPSADRIAALRARALAAPAAPPVQVSTTPTRTVTPIVVRPRSRRWLAAAAAVVALVAGFTAGRLTGDDAGDDEVAGEVEYDGPMTGPDGTPLDADLTVVGTGIGRVIDLRTATLPILPVSEYYQIWFVGPGDTPTTPNRISAGTFHPDPDGRSDVRFAAAVDPALYPVVEITAEPGDGNPAPTGAVVLRAELGT